MEHNHDNFPESIEEMLTPYLLGELDGERRERLEAALEENAELSARLEELRGALAMLQAAKSEPTLSPSTRDALRRAADGGSKIGAPKTGGRPRAPIWFKIAVAASLLVVVTMQFTGTADGWLRDSESITARATDWGPTDGSPDGSASVEALGYIGPSQEQAGKDYYGLEKMDTIEEMMLDESTSSVAFDSAGDAVALGLGGGAGGAAAPMPKESELVAFALEGTGGAAPPASQPVAPATPGTATAPSTPNLGVSLKLRSGGAQPGRRYKGPETRLRAELRSSASERLNDDLSVIGYASQLADAPVAVGEDFEFEDHDGRFGYDRVQQQVFTVDGGCGRRYTPPQLLHHLRPRKNESPRDMFYRYYGDNPFVRTNTDALSTFAADVDTASYPLVRNYLVRSTLPPREAVRTEEFLNYFDNGLAAPTEGDFAVALEMNRSPFGDNGEKQMLRIGVKAREITRDQVKPLNLVFVIDRSGSMDREDRIVLVQRALGLLLDQLRPGDTVGLVAFNADAHRILDPTDVAERWVIREAIDKLEPGGSTNAEAGLLMGYEMAERAYRKGSINRVVLCSDGVANTGETDQARILERIQRSSEQDVDLTTIGVGMGNHNDVFLERMADNGNGACHYVDDFEEAKKVFVEQFTGTMQTIARDVKIQVEFNRAHILRWRQLGYENRAVADKDFRNDAVDAGEIGSGHNIVALYELEPGVIDGDPVLATVRMRWFSDGAGEATEQEWKLRASDAAFGQEPTSRYFRLATVAAQFAEVLRRSHHARGDDYGALVAAAGGLAHDFKDDKRVAELRDMIRRTQELVDRLPHWDELAQLIEECRRGRLLEAELAASSERTSDMERMLREIQAQNAEMERALEELLRKQSGEG